MDRLRGRASGPATAPVPRTVELDDAELRQRLDPLQYRVLREAATERPFTGRYVHEHADGTYRCAACAAPLFAAGAKFDSGTGWPSFDEPANAASVELREDRALGIRRTEVLCRACGSHVGHCFPDGPTATGMRYCINSCALDLEPRES